MTSYPAGWYPDHSDATQRRYWDGEQWTHFVDRPAGDGGGSRWRRRRTPTFKPSAQLVDATYRMLFADRSMIALLFAGAVVAALASGAILFPATHWGHITPTWSSGGVLGVVVAGAAFGAANFVFELTVGAVVGAAMLRAEGRPASVRRALGLAWARRRQLLAWALVATVVGAVIRVLERSGVGGLIAAWTLDVGWAFATVFATPVIMVEGTMPAATIRRSAGLLRRQFPVTLVTGITAALPWMVLAFGSMFLGVIGAGTLEFGSGATALTVGALLLAAGALGLCFSLVVSSAVTAYLETSLYRYAVGLPVPGVDQRWLPPLRPAS